MKKRLISESAARSGIFLVFSLVLACSILFAGSAKILSVSALQPGMEIDPAYDVERLLSQINLLEVRLDSMEADLDGAKRQNAQLLETLDEVEDGFSIEYAGTFYATSYCAEEYPHICGGNGVTASGTVPTPGITVAADWGVLPAGTWLYIDGVGMRRVEDTGSAIKGNRLDVVLDTHANALAWSGQGNHDVWIVTWDTSK